MLKIVTDYVGRTVSYAYPPKKIISFAPAITETLYSFGLDEKIVGRTRFCKFPVERIKKAVNVGGTKDFKIERIHELQPDLIIMEKEENTKEMAEELSHHYPVYVFEVQTVNDALKMIVDLGSITDCDTLAKQLVKNIRMALDELPTLFSHKKATYVIWKNPYMVVGKSTYIQSMLETIGLDNPFTSYEGRYPTITAEDFQKTDLDFIFLATEPFPFQEKHIEEFALLNPNASVQVIDGEMFWYGVKMLEAIRYLKERFSK